MNIEYNEQKVRDVEVPLQQLDQRMQLIEGQMLDITRDNITKLICANINNNAQKLLPNVMANFEKYLPLLDQLQKEQDAVGDQSKTTNASSKNLSQSDFSDLATMKENQFAINMLKNELNLLN